MFSIVRLWLNILRTLSGDMGVMRSLIVAAALMLSGLVAPALAQQELSGGLLVAITVGQVETVQAALEAGLAPDLVVPGDIAEFTGVTILMLAASAAQPQIVQLLVEAGADTQRVDADNRSALWYAVFSGDYDSFAYLAARPGAAGLVDLASLTTGNTPLLIAVRRDDPRITAELLAMGANRLARDLNDRSAAEICALIPHGGCDGL